MDPASTIASLPPHIIRRIGKLIKESTSQLLLISPAWNACVMSTRPSLASVDRVMIRQIARMVKGSETELRLISPAWNDAVLSMRPNVASLDPTILKKIIRMADDMMEDLRLISPSWQTHVTEFLTTTRLGPLERVYLYSGLASDEDDMEDEMAMHFHRGQSVQMVAILPERHSRNVGVGQWLSVYQTHAPEATEVVSAPQRPQDFVSAESIEETPNEGDSEPLVFGPQPHPADFTESGKEANDVLLSMLIGSVTIILIVSYNLIGMNLLGLRGAGGGAEGDPIKMQQKMFRRMMGRRFALPKKKGDEEESDEEEQEQGKKSYPQVTRFLTMFSSIETLVLEQFSLMATDVSFLDAVANTLGAAKINRLEIRDHNFGNEQQNGIVEMCRKHGIRHLFIGAHKFKINNIREFLKQLAELDVAVDLYEVMGGQGQVYFNRSKLHWDKMAAELLTEKVSLRMSAFYDPNFANGGYNQNDMVKAHIRCEKSDVPIVQPLIAVDTKRGFNLQMF